MNSNTIRRLQLAALALLSSFIIHPSSLFGQGSLSPPGAPAPTMKTLTQIEPRTPISSAPYTITNAGSYYLTTNIIVATGDAITLATNGVTLDLSGFTIASTAPSATGYGILLTSNLSDITILNGHIRGGVTNNGSGSYSGPGFGYGIYYPGAAVGNMRVAGISVSGCRFYGIVLAPASSAVVGCQVRTIGGTGIYAYNIQSCEALDCGGFGLSGERVSDSHGESTGAAYGISATAAQNSYGSGTSTDGISCWCAQNCGGYTATGWGGLVATTALNCYGGTGGSNCGLYGNTAQNCYGYSQAGTGLYAIDVAQNCFGTSTIGTGLYAGDTAQTCSGTSTSGTGLHTYIAIGCRGVSSTGTGLSATLANSCLGSSVSATYKYNMP